MIAPNTGLPTLIGDLRQTEAASLGGGKGKFGQNGAKLRLLATGIGTRPTRSRAARRHADRRREPGHRLIRSATARS